MNVNAALLDILMRNGRKVGEVGMGLLNDKELDKYLALIGTFFACELRDKQDDAFANETYRLFCAVREHIYTLMKNGEWISVKDRLPERENGEEHIHRKWYLVALESGCVEILRYEFEDGHYINQGWAYTPVPVTYWMPLPEPPKEVSE